MGSSFPFLLFEPVEKFSIVLDRLEQYNYNFFTTRNNIILGKTALYADAVFLRLPLGLATPCPVLAR